MNTGEFNKAREEITDEQLINKTQETLHKLCETGGRSFIMTVPPRIDDTDMIFGELINRYKKAIQVQAPVKPEIAEDIVREIAFIVFRDTANAYRLYPENKHTFAEYWETALHLKRFIKQ